MAFLVSPLKSEDEVVQPRGVRPHAPRGDRSGAQVLNGATQQKSHVAWLAPTAGSYVSDEEDNVFRWFAVVLMDCGVSHVQVEMDPTIRPKTEVGELGGILSVLDLFDSLGQLGERSPRMRLVTQGAGSGNLQDRCSGGNPTDPLTSR